VEITIQITTTQPLQPITLNISGGRGGTMRYSDTGRDWLELVKHFAAVFGVMFRPKEKGFETCFTSVVFQLYRSTPSSTRVGSIRGPGRATGQILRNLCGSEVLLTKGHNCGRTYVRPFHLVSYSRNMSHVRMS